MAQILHRTLRDDKKNLLFEKKSILFFFFLITVAVAITEQIYS